jgi:hypothetical protein
MLTLETNISIPKDVLFQETADEVTDEMVLLNLANGKYFSLDDVGTRRRQVTRKDMLRGAGYFIWRTAHQ